MRLPDYSAIKQKLKGELHTDFTTRKLYATDASAYREIPQAVAIPANDNDIEVLIEFANKHKLSLIPRTAGTSLAGQVVGGGIVVDVSKNFTQILEVNEQERWVRVQPGVIRDELNMHLSSFDLLFGPETSTANRAMIGGMIGNNSCGSNSVVYNSTREHLISVKGYLSDGSIVEFTDLSQNQLNEKLKLQSLEGDVYRNINDILASEENQKLITEGFPKPSINRRNTGYAIDLLRLTAPYSASKTPLNMAKLVAGSEGTLMFITEAKLALEPIPKGVKGLLCIHFDSINESLKGNLIALKYSPHASELMDHHILDRTKDNINHRQNRFFIKGEPKAILVVELLAENKQKLEQMANELTNELKANKLGYHFPLVTGTDITKVWNLRKAGLGLLSNVPGDAKPAPVIEDTAVDVNDLPAYIEEFNQILDKHGLYCVHYAHAGSGELHLRPILNLKTAEGHRLFRTILDEIAQLVKKYQGSLSGEHGDGRLRGEFIQFMIGEKNYEFIKAIKKAWDPHNIFNPGKIVDTPPMDTSLRFEAGQETRQFDTILNFDENQGYLRAAEQCNGSGDCRKTHLSGGTMCPSYMATKNEKDTTRARANILREVLTHSQKTNAFDSEEIKEVMDLCLSCKGCKSECPSNVDVGKLKAEFQHQYYKSHGVPLRTKMIANFTKLNKLASKTPGIYNFVMQNSLTAPLIKGISGFAAKRSIPAIHRHTLRKWYEKRPEAQPEAREVYLFCDEFTDYNDTPIGIKTVELLERIGIKVNIIDHLESGRTFLSKGLLEPAKKIATQNVNSFAKYVTADMPLVGIEPSAILTFRDEYPDLVERDLRETAQHLAKNTLTIEEYLLRLADQGVLTPRAFSSDKKKIKLHGHCHQKALGSVSSTEKILSLPENYSVDTIPSGCCGMAGSFGYEKEHYDVSMKIGELVLFPAVRAASNDTIIAAPGTSCRHQIKDGTGKAALHPIEVLYDAMII
ncbi:FAD-binding oxidoreductase [Fulvivirga sp. RKSG066]|uniref:FAD-binding and (Fe-S)-binding domain-containing protein n=1 Tax=Fulvivirga aurantia TaxID=2529383 RepID=UPI0012BB7A1F|nr:FAD-binding and (Fe-S)-binding domain-containing protein [Fulvivirga aurantia]MTI20100.1 FAD-binding oxidoreductase [Fulvivirga aurantia]